MKGTFIRMHTLLTPEMGKKERSVKVQDEADRQEPTAASETTETETVITVAHDVLDTKEKRADFYARLKAAGLSAQRKFEKARRDTEDAALTRRVG